MEDGLNINIRSDKWLPGDTYFKLYISASSNSRSYHQSRHRYDMQSNSWNKDLLQKHFCPLDIQRILQIPSPHMMMAWLPARKMVNIYLV